LSRVGLTFDDGPGPWTEPVLDLLAEHSAHATFFVIGSHTKKHANLVRRMVADGHEVGNHTWSHKRLADTPSSRVISRELQRTNKLLEKILGSQPERFRAPEYNIDGRVEALATSLGLRHTHGDVTPPDWDPRCTSAYIAAFVLARVQPGCVIGLHDGVPPHMQRTGATRQPTVDALAEILPRLTQRGLESVTASQLAASRT
jgi:peptidoglycan/xylan/chitin deacetylase (PgdA/CDA1 family)